MAGTVEARVNEVSAGLEAIRHGWPFLSAEIDRRIGELCCRHVHGPQGARLGGELMIDLRAYWPQPAAGTQLIVQSKTDAFSTPGQKTITRRYVNRGTVEGNPVMRMDEYNSTGWLSGWSRRLGRGTRWAS